MEEWRGHASVADSRVSNAKFLGSVTVPGMWTAAGAADGDNDDNGDDDNNDSIKFLGCKLNSPEPY
jgi:hypothetical protein